MKRTFVYFLIMLTVPALFFLAYPAAAARDPYGTGGNVYRSGNHWIRLGPYITFKGGMFFPQSDLDDLGFDDSFYGEFAIGGRPHRAFAMELAGGWARPERDFPGGTVKTTIVPIMLNAKVPIPIGPVTPYILFGAGGYWVEVKGGGLPKDDDWTYGFQAGAGVDFTITPSTTIGLEGKYHWAEPTLNGMDIEIEGFNVVGTLGFHY